MTCIGGLDVVDKPDPLVASGANKRAFGRSQVGSLMPFDFDSYIRILHPAYRTRYQRTSCLPDLCWSEVSRRSGRPLHRLSQFESLLSDRYSLDRKAFPDDGTLTVNQTSVLTRVLPYHTATPDRCYFAVWDGWNNLSVGSDRLATFRFDGTYDVGRRYILLTGPIASVTQSLARLPFRWQSPSMWWPEDRSWCVSTEIDLNSTYVGSSVRCAEALSRTGILEVFPSAADDDATIQSDR